MSRQKLTQEQISEIEYILNNGGSQRKAAEEILGSKTRESTIRYNIRKGKISLSDNNTENVDISEEQLDTLCDHPDFSISNLAKRLRSSQRTCTQLRKIQRELFDGEGSVTDLREFSELLSKSLGESVIPKRYEKYTSDNTNRCTVEILFSDLQIGKCSEFYNTDNATKAMKYYGEEVLNIVKDTNPEKIIFSSLGDIIECSKKHGLQSAYSTDTSNAQQLSNATSLIWKEVLEPLVSLGVPLTVVGVAGNHGADAGKGFDMYKAGLYTYDYVIYQSLKLLCEAVNAKHVDFNVPEGCFATYEIYGNTYLAEHGYFNQCTEKSMMDHKKKRMDNLKEYLHGYRCGDMHHVCLYDSSNLVVNGSFFGIEREGAEYSGILGFNAVPAQVVMIHKPLKGNRLGQSTVTETKIIQVAKSYV